MEIDKTGKKKEEKKTRKEKKKENSRTINLSVIYFRHKHVHMYKSNINKTNFLPSHKSKFRKIRSSSRSAGNRKCHHYHFRKKRADVTIPMYPTVIGV